MMNCRFSCSFRASLLVLLQLTLCLAPTVRAQNSNGVLREVYLNIGGGSISDLTNHPSFPNSPSLETIQPIFEAPNEFAENYGQRMRALLVAPLSGNYTFWIASDDGGALFLSTNEDPAQRVQIAAVGGWTNSREWTKEPNQQSATNIALVAGQRYYIEALQKEGGGGDNLAVRWRLPNNAIEEPIPNNRLLVFGLGPPVITQQPTNVTIVEEGSATFSVRLQHGAGATYLWKRNGTTIPNATNTSYTLSPASLGDNTSFFSCSVTNALGGTNSTSATLTVTPDITRPTISTAGNLGGKQVAFLVFSEPVEAATATNSSNYSFSGGVSVIRAEFGVDSRTIILTTTTLAPNTTYVITVNNVRDRATTPNTILPNSQTTFSMSTGQPLDIGLLSLSKEPLGPSSRRHGVVISEVMYHPTNRVDGRKLEFIEIYNSQAWFEEIGGWRISGAVDYTFPPGTTIPAGSFVVVAANPADMQTVYGITGVFGPFANSNSLPNDSGLLRLGNNRDAILFEMNYTGEPPYPAAADGAGHSLVLARPSYGEHDPRAWAASDVAGGSPLAHESSSSNPYRTIVINEFLAHTDLPQVDYIELFNYGANAVNVGGCFLTDDPATNKFTIPANTIIPARGFALFTQNQLGYALSASGETILLRNPAANRVIDSVRFGAQENGVSTGRYPDGAASFSRLAAVTPGTNNTPVKVADIVINEIMFDPITGDANDEYVELFNRGTNAVNLTGWRLQDAVTYKIPTNTIVPAGGYLVLAKNTAKLRTNHVGLNLTNCLGNYSGTLANGGEHIELTMPDDITSTNTQGQLKTNIIHIRVDEVSYGPGGRWGKWAGGGGSSLELRDARTDKRLAPNWADSDESSKSAWITVETTGVMDNGWADANQLHITLLGAGEALVDNIEVIPAGGANLVANGTFDSGAAGWVFQGNHNQTSWESGEGFGGNGSMHLRATGRGDSGSNRTRTQLPYTLSSGTVVTLRAKVRWLKGNPNILLRLRGNWLEAPGYILTARNLGTPGTANSRAVPNAGPAITDVRHDPPLPTANQPVLISARVNDPDGLAFLAVKYRIDPNSAYTTVPMTNNGAGVYSTVLPGQASGATAAFFIHAADNFSPPKTTAYPDDAPSRECIVRWGDTTILGTLGTYRMWLSQATIDKWVADERMSNDPKDITFIYGTNRVIYNAGGWFHGSPYHSPGYDSPVGNLCDYDLGFPADEKLLGETDINLFRPGNGGGDGTGQAEIHGYWFGGQFGVPFLYHRPVFVHVNGQLRSAVFHDAQQPNGDFINQWYPDDTNGDLHKVQLGFEFGDQAYGANEPGYAVVGANLGNYTTTGGVKKQARYRATWPLRSASPQEQNDYTNLYTLVETVLTNAPVGSDAYTAALTNLTDVEEWYKVHVTQHLFNNIDSFSYGGGQNAFAYKPEHDTWKLFLWDVDFAFSGVATNSNLTGIGGADHGPVNTHPPFQRIYWQALIEAANGMMTSSRSDTIIDARYNGMAAAGAAIGSPQYIKDFIAARRAYILGQISSNQSPFAITSNGGADFSTNRNLAFLSGTAPLEVRAILVNGIPYPISWPSFNTWVIRVPLSSGTNTLLITGVDPKGSTVAGVAGTIQVNYTGGTENPRDKLVINEIMYNPLAPNASFVEIYNSSGSNAFDLSNWRLDGVDFKFGNGTVIEANTYLVLAGDRQGFASAHGSLASVVGEFAGKLDNSGQTLTLVKPGATPALDQIIDQVTYDKNPPWPADANGFGSSLQLIDPSQDNNRVANWTAVPAGTTNIPQTLITITNAWKYQSTSDLTGVNWVASGFDDSGWGYGLSLLYNENAALPAPKNTPLALGRTTYYFRAHFNFTGSSAGVLLSLSTVIDDGAVFYLNGQEIHRLRMPAGPVTYDTLTSAGVGDAVFEGPFLLPGSSLVSGDNVLAVEVHQSAITSSDIVFGMTLATTYNAQNPFTPGAPNSVRASLPAFPTLWLNEVLPNNFFLGTNGIVDHLGDRDPWVELYNGGTNAISLDGFFLANNYTNLTQWAFPAGAAINPKQFLVVWLDGEPGESTAGEFHTSFRAAPAIGSVVLIKGSNAPVIIDYLNYAVPTAGRSHGSFPDGNASNRRLFSVVTPGITNNPASVPVTIFINEWMADNTLTLADPADGDYEDWFELYNPGTNVVSLDGFFLTDDLTNATKFLIPPGTSIPAGGYLLVWADGEPGQNGPGKPDLHASFSLSKSGEAIGLFAPDGTLIDAISFGPQTSNVSQGRFKDGGASILFMVNPTPGSANVIDTTNSPPILAAVGNKTVNELELLTFTSIATDSNSPPQTLTFSLEGAVPSGAFINPSSGVFAWVPTEAQGPGSYPLTIRVTDNGNPALSDIKSFVITVKEVNTAPTITFILDQFIDPGATISLQLVAADNDLPPQTLTYSLEPGGPPQATINPSSGLFTWTPGSANAPSTNLFTVQVADNGSPSLFSTRSFKTIVTAVLQAKIGWSANSVSLAFSSTIGRTYRIQYKSTLGDATWTKLGSDIVAVSDTISIVDNNPTDNQRFYRIVRLD